MKPRFDQYEPVDVDKLRPNRSYDRMVEIREERMKVYVNQTGEVKSEMVEPVVCLVCGADEPRPLFTKEGFQFVQCGRCSLVYVNPSLKEDFIRQVYKHQSYTDILAALAEPSDAYRRERFGKERVAIVDRFLPRHGRDGLRLLDIGCATGFFVHEAQQAGWVASGIESNPYAAEFARRNGLDVRNETIEETTFAPGTFDVVTLFEVIEHVRRPMDILRKAFALLKPGGMVFLYTPNFESAERMFLGNAAHYVWGSNHLSYFTADTLADALGRVGFLVEHSETQGLDIEDVIWYFEQTGRFDMQFARAFRHELTFLINSSGFAKNLRVYARRPA